MFSLDSHQSAVMQAASSKPSRMVWIVFIVGTLLRLVVIPLSSPEYSLPFWEGYGWPADHANYVQWARHTTSPDAGLLSAYTLPPERELNVRLSYGLDFVHHGNGEIINYPPGGLYLIYLQGLIHRAVDPDLVANTACSRIVFESLSAIGDMIMAWGIWALALAMFNNRAASIAFSVIYLIPPIWLDSCWWGQTDSWVLAPMVWMLLAMVRRRWLVAGVLWGIALSLKPHAILFSPIWAFAGVVSLLPVWKEKYPQRQKSDAVRIVLGGVIALAIVNIVALPFWLTSGSAWLEQSYLRNLRDEQPYTTLKSFNIWYVDLLLCYDANVSTTILGITKDLWGKFFLVLGLIASVVASWRAAVPIQQKLVVFTGLWLLAVVMLPTRVHERYILLCLPCLIVTCLAFKRMWPGVIGIIVIATFQLTVYHWLSYPADSWTKKWIDDTKIHLQEAKQQTPAEYQHLLPTQERALELRYENFLKEHRKQLGLEWGLTIFSLVAATITYFGAWPGRKRNLAKNFHFIDGHTEEHIATMRQLFQEYADELTIDLSFQDFEQELANLPGDYAPPSGCVIIAYHADKVAACVALRPLEEGICEMKRLFVRPAFRGMGLGKTLAMRIMQQADDLGYRRMRLDTITTMTAANGLYESLGFRDIHAYRHNPIESARFMEVEIGSGSDD